MKEHTDFDKWLEAQSEEVQTLIKDRFTALENTVKATRLERDTFSNELKELGKKLEKGSEAELRVNELTNKLALAEKKTNFLEKAHSEGCLRPSAAFALLNSENLFTEQGEPDWKRLREAVPELFRVRDTKTNAGAGTKQVVADDDPNLTIRQAANKQIR